MHAIFVTQIPRAPARPEVRPFEMEAARALAREIPVTVLAFDQDGGAGPAVGEAGGVRVVRPRMRSVPGGRLTLQAAAMALAAVPWVRRLAADGRAVLHAQFGCPAGVAAVHAGRRLGLPVVVTFRGSDVAEAPRHADLRAATGWALRRASRIVAVAHHLVPGLRALGASDGALQVVYDGVDRGLFRPQPAEAPGPAAVRARLGLAPADRLVLYVGRLVPGKGVADLLRAHARLGERVHVALLGGGGAWIAREVRSLGTGARVQIPSEAAYREVPDWMNAADCVCLPSRAEGRPSVALEARACGRPVAATRIPGHEETLAGYAPVAWAPAGAPALLAEAVSSVLGRGSAGAADRGWTPPGWDDTARALISLYRGLQSH